jgi:hypothetical protein
VGGDWRRWAACRGIPSSLFFPSHSSEIAVAKAVCHGCPVRDACLWSVMLAEIDPQPDGCAPNPEHRHGVFGGLSALERVELGHHVTRVDIVGELAQLDDAKVS